jgi:outer membrane protein assembly factor BamB
MFNHDAARTGVDASSPPLGQVRRAWASPVLDGAIYAQPLVFAGRVFVATENNSVYSFDAATGSMRWRRHLGNAVPRSSLPCGNIDPTGITGTPAIDPATGVLYVVAFLQPGRHELFAMGTVDGRPRFHRSVDPDGIDPLAHQQRAALTIANGRVYVAFGGLFGDCGDFRGLVVGSSLDGTGPLITYRVPSGHRAGIWAPSGPTVDPSGNLLVTTGNSDSSSTFDFGSAVIKLNPDLKLVDWFAPANWVELNLGDVDLGSVGPALLPGGLVFQVGKEGVGYLLRLDDLGKIGGQVFDARVCPGPAFGGTAVKGQLLYVSCSGGLLALRVTGGPRFEVAWGGPGFDAGPPIVAGGAVWTMDVSTGELFAFDAASGKQLFRTTVGDATHFTSPAAADGRLYVATLSRLVVAFSGI